MHEFECSQNCLACLNDIASFPNQLLTYACPNMQCNHSLCYSSLSSIVCKSLNRCLPCWFVSPTVCMTSIATAEQMCMTAGPPTYLVPSHCSSDSHYQCQRSFPTLLDTVQTAGAPRKASHGNADTGAALHLFHFIPHCINSICTAYCCFGFRGCGVGSRRSRYSWGCFEMAVQECRVIVFC